jgi:hypothetical protein
MAPSAKIQSRIQAFEALGSNYPPHTYKTTTQELHDLLETPISPTAKSFSPIVPSIPNTIASPSPSPPNLGRKTSLIDLKDWVVDDGPPRPASSASNPHYAMRRPPPPPRRAGTTSEQASSMPLINLQAAPEGFRSPPPIPPKMPSYTSLRGQLTTNSEVPAKRSDSLTVEHTYPPFLTLDTNSRMGLGHAHASSISSFHSVSLSDNENGPSGSVSNGASTHPTDHDYDADSLDESFENVSAISSSATFASYDQGGYENTFTTTPVPPKLPERPKSRPAPSTAHSPPSSPKRYNGSTGGLARRLPPPPPRPGNSNPHSSRTSFTSTTASDRSSIMSNPTSRISTGTSLSTQSNSQLKLSPQLTRQTPVPAAAKQRYEYVFIANVRTKRKADKSAATANASSLAPSNLAGLAVPGRQTRKAAGWRGLSVDLTTNPEEALFSVHDTDSMRTESLDFSDPEDVVGVEERLDGHTVKRIWSMSRLERVKLRDIWYVAACLSPNAAPHFYNLSRLGTTAILISWGPWIWMRLSKACGVSMKSCAGPGLGRNREPPVEVH